MHGKLPTRAELASYKTKLKSLRGVPAAVKRVLEELPASTHPMDVMRTGVSALGCVMPEKDDHHAPGAREIADRLMASLGSMLLYWYHFAINGKRIDVETDDDSIGGHFLHLLHGKRPSELWVRSMHTSLILYAEHEFNASTFAARVIAGTGSDMYSCIAGAIGALRGPKHGGANEAAFEIQNRYDTPDEAEADIRARVERKEVVIGFGHPVYTIGDPRNKVIKEVARELSAAQQNMKMFEIAERLESTMWDDQEDVPEPRLVQRGQLPHDGRADRDVHAAVRDFAHVGLERARDRAAQGRQDHPAERELHRCRKIWSSCRSTSADCRCEGVDCTSGVSREDWTVARIAVGVTPAEVFRVGHAASCSASALRTPASSFMRFMKRSRFSRPERSTFCPLAQRSITKR